MMSNINIRIDKDVKEKSDKIFNELGFNMTTAITMFLRTTIRENGIPFDLKLDLPNIETTQAIEEGRKLAVDPNTKKYSSMEELKVALDE